MRKILDYKIVVSADGPRILEALVKKEIDGGWEPFGPLVNHGNYLLQAVVEYSSRPVE